MQILDIHPSREGFLRQGWPVVGKVRFVTDDDDVVVFWAGEAEMIAGNSVGNTGSLKQSLQLFSPSGTQKKNAGHCPCPLHPYLLCA